MIRFVTYFLNNKNWEGRRVQAKKKKKMVIPWIKLKTTTKIARKRKDDEGKGVETNLRTCHLLVSRGWGIKDDSGLHSECPCSRVLPAALPPHPLPMSVYPLLGFD